MPYNSPTDDEIQDLSRERPDIEAGDKIIVCIGKLKLPYGTTGIATAVYRCGHTWLVDIITSPNINYPSGRTVCVYAGRVQRLLKEVRDRRFKVNHKIGVPKGKLP